MTLQSDSFLYSDGFSYVYSFFHFKYDDAEIE